MLGQEETFRRWLKEHRGILVKVSRAYTSGEHDREDLSQEILMQWWRSIPSFRQDARESTWVYRVAINTAMTWRRDSRNGRKSETLKGDLPCPRALPDDSASDNELVEWLYAEMAALPKADRSLLLLYLEGISYRDMAEILGISETNVGVKLNRLKKQLAERGRESDHGH